MHDIRLLTIALNMFALFSAIVVFNDKQLDPDCDLEIVVPIDILILSGGSVDMAHGDYNKAVNEIKESNSISISSGYSSGSVVYSNFAGSYTHIDHSVPIVYYPTFKEVVQRLMAIQQIDIAELSRRAKSSRQVYYNLMNSEGQSIASDSVIRLVLAFDLSPDETKDMLRLGRVVLLESDARDALILDGINRGYSINTINEILLHVNLSPLINPEKHY